MCVSFEWWVEVTFHWARAEVFEGPEVRRCKFCGLWNLVFRVASSLQRPTLCGLSEFVVTAGNDTSEFLSRLSSCWCGLGGRVEWSGALATDTECGGCSGVKWVKWVSS